jgi:hypothetical protein
MTTENKDRFPVAMDTPAEQYVSEKEREMPGTLNCILIFWQIPDRIANNILRRLISRAYSSQTGARYATCVTILSTGTAAINCQPGEHPSY